MLVLRFDEMSEYIGKKIERLEKMDGSLELAKAIAELRAIRSYILAHAESMDYLAWLEGQEGIKDDESE